MVYLGCLMMYNKVRQTVVLKTILIVLLLRYTNVMLEASLGNLNFLGRKTHQKWEREAENFVMIH